MDSELSEEFDCNVRIQKGSRQSALLLAVVVDVVTELAIDGVLSELLYVEDLVLMNGSIE